MDESGELTGIGVEFYSGNDKLGQALTRPESFVQDLWISIAGGVPAFEFVDDQQKVLVDRFSKGGVNGRWTTRFRRALVPTTITDRVVIQRQ